MAEQSKPAYTSIGIGLAIGQLGTAAFMIAQDFYTGGFGAIQTEPVTIACMAIGQIIERLYSHNRKLYIKKPKNAE
jgi:hypothetical protein